jgi:hypothetical protein
MNLQELTKDVDSATISELIRKQFGKKYKISSLGLTESKRLLSHVLKSIDEYKNQNGIQRSETDPLYIKMTMVKEATAKRINELLSENKQEPQMKSNYVQALKKVAAGGSLSVNEVKSLRVSAGLKRVLENQQTAIAFIKRIVENKRMQGRQLNEAEIDSAQVVLAAQDIADQVQDMIEKFADIQYKELPALQDGIRKEMGVDTATQFNDAVLSSLQSLTGALEQARTDLTNAVAMLTGDETVGTGDLDLDGIDGEMDVDADLDLDVDADMDDEGDEDFDLDFEEEPEDEELMDLGREKR